MSRKLAIAALSLGLLSAVARADDGFWGAVIGGGAGAVIGQSIGGRDGAIIGGAVGAAAGVAIADDHRATAYAPRPVYVGPPMLVTAVPVRYERMAWEQRRHWREERREHDEGRFRRHD